MTPKYSRCNPSFQNKKDDVTLQQCHVTNSHLTCKGSWEMTTLSPWQYVNEEVPSMVVTLWHINGLTGKVHDSKVCFNRPNIFLASFMKSAIQVSLWDQFCMIWKDDFFRSFSQWCDQFCKEKLLAVKAEFMTIQKLLFWYESAYPEL